MSLNSRNVAALLLVCVGFFFILACLDYLLMANFNFWVNVDLLYRYWIILWLVVIVFAFGLGFMGYVLGVESRTVLALFFTMIFLFAGGLLDLFYALFCLVQGQNYDFAGWSAQYKMLVQNGWLSAWTWPLQALWSIFFFVLVGLLWYWALRKKAQ